MEPVRLWRFKQPTTIGGRKYPSPMHYEDGDPIHRDDEGCTERFAALPRADFDALVARAERAERERDEARALLRELTQYRYEFSDDQIARIDALLRGDNPAPAASSPPG